MEQGVVESLRIIRQVNLYFLLHTENDTLNWNDTTTLYLLYFVSLHSITLLVNHRDEPFLVRIFTTSRKFERILNRSGSLGLVDGTIVGKDHKSDTYLTELLLQLRNDLTGLFEVLIHFSRE